MFFVLKNDYDSEYSNTGVQSFFFRNSIIKENIQKDVSLNSKKSKKIEF